MPMFDTSLGTNVRVETDGFPAPASAQPAILTLPSGSTEGSTRVTKRYTPDSAPVMRSRSSTPFGSRRHARITVTPSMA